MMSNKIHLKGSENHTACNRKVDRHLRSDLFMSGTQKVIITPHAVIVTCEKCLQSLRSTR